MNTHPTNIAGNQQAMYQTRDSARLGINIPKVNDAYHKPSDRDCVIAPYDIDIKAENKDRGP